MAALKVDPNAIPDKNFIYRGVLKKTILKDDKRTESVIIKHCTDHVAVNGTPSTIAGRQLFEEYLFRSVSGYSPLLPANTIITAPRLFLYNRDTGTQILEDFAGTTSFKQALFGVQRDTLIPVTSRRQLGQCLGSWLRSFHAWASAPEQATLRECIPRDDPMRKLKRSITYDRFLEVLGSYPELQGRENVLKTIQDAMLQEFAVLPGEADENWGIIHADLWSGNILIPSTGWQDPASADHPNKLFIIDWKFTQFGHRCYDLGQLIGDLCERKVYNNVDTSVPVVQGIIQGYGPLTDSMAFRVAIHVGVHVIGWYGRRPRGGPWAVANPEVVAGLTMARNFVLKGWEKDRKFFQDTLIVALFTGPDRAC